MQKKPIEVLALTLNSSLGGTEKSLLSLYARIDKDFFRPTIATLIGDGTLLAMAGQLAIPAVDLRLRGPCDGTVLFRLAELMRTRSFGIVHTSIYHTGIVGRLMGWAVGIPIVVCSARSTDDWRSPVHNRIDTWTQGFVDCYLANCQAVAKKLREEQRIDPERIRVIRTSIEPLTVPDPEVLNALRSSLALPDHAKLIGTVANFRAAKGHAQLIQAAKKVVAVFPDVVFLWVGDGDLRGPLENALERAGLQNHFRLVGFQKDPSPYYGICDMLVLPSLWEGLPLTLLEAASVGLPIVATRVGGVGEILQDGQDARLIPAGDTDALSAAILDLLRFRDRTKKMGLCAQARFNQENSVSRTVTQTEQLYKELLQRSAPCGYRQELLAHD